MKQVEQKRSWDIEEQKFICARLEELLRSPAASEEEIRIATDMLAFYKQFRWC